MTAAPILDVKDLKKYYGLGGGALRNNGYVHAVDDVSFSISRGETLSLVGESGCGKSTVGRAILRLTNVTKGEIWLDGRRIDRASRAQMQPLRQQLQAVFQDPFSSLNPRMRVRDVLAEPLVNFRIVRGRKALSRKIGELLDLVHLPQAAADKYPHEFSGGQRQRICIARALAPGAGLIICDEAVSALDVSVKAQIVNLLVDLQARLGLALLFISHDLAIVEHMTHRVAVMYLGKIVEIADRRDIFGLPAHPYTQALLSAVPVPNPARVQNRIVLSGDLPSPINPPLGCRFHTRCPYAFDRCRAEEPRLTVHQGEGHLAACHLDVLPGIPPAHPAKEIN